MQLLSIPIDLRRMHDPPRQLYLVGNDHANWQELLQKPRLAVVGSRAASPYGQQVTQQLVSAVVTRGVVIVSGLALGIDAIAHQAAIEAGGQTIAVLPSGIQYIYPATNRRLASEIIKHKGAIISEYGSTMPPHKYNFIARNRLIAGLSQSVLITEAGEKSGSLHTANFALEHGKDVLAVPGSIFSPTSNGTNRLIKDGATPITSVAELLDLFSFVDYPNKPPAKGSNPAEQKILDLIAGGITSRAELAAQSQLSFADFGQAFSMLEIKELIKPLPGDRWIIG